MAMLARPRIEHTFRDSLGGFFHADTGVEQLRFGAGVDGATLRAVLDALRA